ncbi:Protein kinase [Phytophthora palmivora]|uniref:Protein kinase n=1 Tax=Phytophthora palmivora TaxID=4796 RepID=A0A2P4YQV3_9STRA|nr:Protein kinase [Phytophthora palmivora]
MIQYHQQERPVQVLPKPGVPKMLAPLRDKLGGATLTLIANVTPISETSTISECSFTEFHTNEVLINKARIPRDKVVVQEFISRGAFGKVFKGTYNGQLVAVKTMTDVDSFVVEIKMACAMSHPNIVQFIGVAWNYREDFCCVMEYMDSGDLRGVLSSYLHIGWGCF